MDVRPRREMIVNAALRKYNEGGIPTFTAFADSVTEKTFADAFGMSSADFRRWLDDDIKAVTLLEDFQLRHTDPLSMKLSRDYGFVTDGKVKGEAIDGWGCTWGIDCLGQELRKSPIDDIEEMR